MGSAAAAGRARFLPNYRATSGTWVEPVETKRARFRGHDNYLCDFVSHTLRLIGSPLFGFYEMAKLDSLPLLSAFLFSLEWAVSFLDKVHLSLRV